MKAEPQKEHEWLQKLVGEWTYDGDAAIGPGQARSKFEGRESVRSLGNVWVVAEGQGECPSGEPAVTITTLGYDPQRERFVGTWIGSMMTHLWVYGGGSLDAAGKVLTLVAEGPSFAGEGKMATYQDVIEFKGDDHRVLTSSMLGDDGAWHEFVTVRYRRTK